MLMVASLTNTNWCKNLKTNWNPGTWVLVWEFSARVIQWIPIWQGLDGFQKSLGPCAFDERSLSIRRVTFHFIFRDWTSQGLLYHSKQRNPVLVNMIIIIAKNEIHKCTNNQKQPTLTSIVYQLKGQFRLEEFPAVTHGTTKTFLGKWSPLYNVLKIGWILSVHKLYILFSCIVVWNDMPSGSIKLYKK